MSSTINLTWLPGTEKRCLVAAVVMVVVVVEEMIKKITQFCRYLGFHIWQSSGF
jgi:hypothetical protein